MAKVFLYPIYHDEGCEIGVMHKTTLVTQDGDKAMFALVYSQDQDRFEYIAIVFEGICNHCGQKFRKSYDVYSMLRFKEV